MSEIIDPRAFLTPNSTLTSQQVGSRTALKGTRSVPRKTRDASPIGRTLLCFQLDRLGDLHPVNRQQEPHPALLLRKTLSEPNLSNRRSDILSMGLRTEQRLRSFSLRGHSCPSQRPPTLASSFPAKTARRAHIMEVLGLVGEVSAAVRLLLTTCQSLKDRF